MKGPSTEGMVETMLKVDEVDEVPEEEGASEVPTRVLVEEKEEVKYSPGFLPRPNDNKVYAIGEDDYAF